MDRFPCQTSGMSDLFDMLWLHLSVMDLAGLAVIAGLALYGITGIGDHDGFDFGDWDGDAD